MLLPGGTATRAQAAQLVYTYVNTAKYRFFREGETVRQFTVLGHDISEYVIICPAGSSDIVVIAANKLSEYIEKTCGTRLSVADDNRPEQDCEILIGDTSHSGDIGEAPDLNSFRVRAEGTKLALASSDNEGAYMAVYGFLREYVGWRFTSMETESLYYADTLAIGETDRLFDTGMDYFVLMMGNTENSWRVKCGMPTENKYIKMDYYQPSIYFFLDPDAPPEDRRKATPCLSDRTNHDTIIRNAMKHLEENPEVDILNVSQNDDPYYCRCEKCAAVYRAEGTRGGVLVRLTNELAALVAEKYPDKFVAFLPYQYSVPAPNCQMLDNVIVSPVSIECCFNHSFVSDTHRKRLEAGVLCTPA